MIRKIFIISCFLCLFSCQQNSKKEADIAKIPVDFKLARFDKEFAAAQPKDLAKLKNKYPFLFPEKFPDSLWVNKLSDTIQKEINREVAKEFPDFSAESQELKSLFKHVKYYFPQFQIPEVITLTSEVDYKNKVLFTGNYLLISLDTYLGEDHKFYIGIQQFLKKNFKRSQIIPDAANAIAESFVPQTKSRTFLAHMLYYGKLLYLKDIWLPTTSEAEKMGYTKEEMQWAKANEDQVWRYFVERETIFDTNSQLYSRFLYPAPFSKFYLDLDAESPDRIGQYIGWQMVKRYMEKKSVSLEEMLNTPAETIFKNTNYKPKK